MYGSNHHFLIRLNSIVHICEMNHAQLRQWFYSRLSPKFSQGELQALYHWAITEIEGWSRAEAYVHNADHVDEKHKETWETTVDLLAAGKPIQYIFQKAEFFSLELYVNEDVLIPRPETEELVQLVLDEEGDANIQVLDIGTGSGCIPLALKSQRPNWTVSAMDVSQEALDVATKNAQRLALDVRWLHADILNKVEIGEVDVIVSNPPYIPKRLASTLDAHVVDHEPHIALFSPDRDPFLFFKRIAEVAKQHSVRRVFFETHATEMNTLTECLSSIWSGEIETVQDISGKNRFVVLSA